LTQIPGQTQENNLTQIAQIITNYEDSKVYLHKFYLTVADSWNLNKAYLVQIGVIRVKKA
jgi:hypothetical protein